MVRRWAWATGIVVIGVVAWWWRTEPAPAPWRLVRVPAGTFVMGSPSEELGHDAGEEQREVVVAVELWMSTTEVTQGLYREVMGGLPDCHVGARQMGDDLPMHCVSWQDAVAFCAALSAREGLAGDVGYRLPTEAEWEHAARAGQGSVYAGTSEVAEVCRYANVGEGFGCDDGYAELAPVGRYRPNGWGLHDMTGNVSEWVSDRFEPGGPREAERGEERVNRGGSYLDAPSTAGVADRDWGAASRRLPSLGFRVVRPADVTAAASPGPQPSPSPADR